MEPSRFVFVCGLIGGLAALLFLTPFEAYLEAAIAVIIIVIAMAGFLIHPRRDVFYVRTSVLVIEPDGNLALEGDLLAVRVEIVRLWLLFVPTLLAVAIFVFFAASGPKFSYINWVFSFQYAFIILEYPALLVALLVFVLLSAWIEERRVLRDAEACTARSFSISSGHPMIRRVSYQFMAEDGERYGGDCLFFGMNHPRELATIVFHNVRKLQLNKIAMGFLFHRLVIIGRGVTDLDKQTAAAQTALAEAKTLS